MTYGVASERSESGDRTVELLGRSFALWRRWDGLRTEGQPGDLLREEATNLMYDIAAAGEWVLASANRDALTREIARWRRWCADELGEYQPRVGLAPLMVTVSELQDLDYPNLMIMLERGETINGKLVQSIEFAKHLDEVREKFSESKLVDCRFERCKFDGARFGAGTKLVYVTFAECTMDYLIWPQVRASSLVFEDLTVRGAGFESGVFSDVLFRNFRTDRANFMDANFTYCRFDQVESTGTDYAGAVFSKCIFEETQFIGCDLSDTVFSECEFMGASIAGGSLRRALFTRCDLSNLHLMQGPPRGGDASRRKSVDIDLTNIQVRESHELPMLIEHHLQIQDGLIDLVLPSMSDPLPPEA